MLSVFKQYEKLSTKGFAKALMDELSGETEDCLMTLGKCKRLNLQICTIFLKNSFCIEFKSLL